MADENWQIGQSLDALNDLFYGGFGEMKGVDAVELIWTNFEKNRKDLGVACTIAHYKQKLLKPELFNNELFRKKINELTHGKGQTYFDIIQEIIEEHKHIHLIEK